ncbi:MAG: LysM peptidoglycan-binding domain-containing protein [Bacteroidia bacterium]|nr:LysM peptidoglycan-binding domain-containing protein [Bacteroidia bacterium]
MKKIACIIISVLLFQTLWCQQLEDNEFAAFLDSLSNIQFPPQAFLKPNKNLNKNLPSDSIPDFDDHIYRARLAKLDAQTPFDLVYNEDVRQFIRLYLIRKRNSVSRMLGVSQLYYPIFEEIFDRYNLPLELKHLAIIESALIPFAKSRAGAMGLWQFMYPTGKLCGLKINSYTDERCDPYKSTVAAAEYIKQLYDIFKDWQMVLAAYNAGPGTISRAIRRSGGKKNYWEIRPYLPRETQYYVPAFIAANYVMNYASEHNVYAEIPNKNYFEIDTVVVKYPMTFQQISEILDVSVDEIRYFNPQYRKNLIPEGGYSLCLPKDKIRLFLSNENEIYAKVSSQNQMNGSTTLREERKVHVVMKGEKISTIAKKYGVSVQDIKNWNFIGKKGLRPGKKLVIYVPVLEPEQNELSTGLALKKDTTSDLTNPSVPYNSSPTSEIIHKVRKGETLQSIAKKYGVTVQEIKNVNLNISRHLRIGQKIKIPKS